MLFKSLIQIISYEKVQISSSGILLLLLLLLLSKKEIKEYGGEIRAMAASAFTNVHKGCVELHFADCPTVCYR